jgi:large subunit ribosomal protein L32
MRHTKSHTGNRRSHHALKAANLSKCSHCGEMHRPHHMCLNCGYYNGRQVMDLVKKKEEREARIQAKQERMKNELGAAPTPVENEVVVTEEKKEKKSKVK